IVIPEGFASWQIAERLGATGVCDAELFKTYVRANRLEGYLFPTTYFFDPNTPAEKVAQRMRAEFDRRVPPEYQAAQPKPRLTLPQAMTLAAIVEREAVLPQERPMIAAVYLNRMRIGMRLEADPTVQYSLGFWKKGLTLSDLKDDDPYNTYIHYGLPPGPICSFGLDSFRAVLRPAQTNAIYFVADSTGGHIFSATLEEHLKAKRSYKRGLRALKAKLKREQEERESPQAEPAQR
ncbi:MAG: endolytic transglycosylase MltG, partial [Elusimicrobia bacterium]|nr:endolytic transglycosylase MltG [Elusimicrobiota bacterium]